MKSGSLQHLVLNTLREKDILSVREILEHINRQTNKNYAYTTISTTLSRLEKKGVVQSQIRDVKGRKAKIFEIQENAPQKEIQTMLSTLISRFGTKGIRHLGGVFNENLSEEEIEAIRKEFESDVHGG